MRPPDRLPPRPAGLFGDPVRAGRPVSPDDAALRMRSMREHWLALQDFLDRHMHSGWVFRGSPNKDFECKPSAGRISNYDPLFEEHLFRTFKREARLHLSMPEASDWEWLALGQHFGLPTRLLDWTTNPLVACYFAVSSQPLGTDAVIHACRLGDGFVIDPARAAGPFELDRVGFLLPTITAPRISSQRGLFSFHPRPHEAWSPPGLAEHSFVIPGELRGRFRRKLFSLGVDEAHIYADLQGVCLSLSWQYRERHGLGAVT